MIVVRASAHWMQNLPTTIIVRSGGDDRAIASGDSLAIRARARRRTRSFCSTAAITGDDNAAAERRTSVFVLGAVSDLVVLRGIRDARISVVCARLVVERCSRVTIFVNTSTSPLIAKNCADIRLAPYNVQFNVRRQFKSVLIQKPIHSQNRLQEKTSREFCEKAIMI